MPVETHNGMRQVVGQNVPRRRQRRWKRFQTLAAGLLAALLVGGCASAGKRFEQGAELEGEGRYVDATQRYIQALRKDPGMVQARERLVAVAPRVIQQYMEDAEGYRSLGSYVRGANLYRNIDALVSDAGSVGVPLDLPSHYDGSRRTAFNDAIAQLMERGETAESHANWQQALDIYAQIDAYDPTAAQRRRANEARVRTALTWGEADFAAGRYRAAAERADWVLELLGSAAHPALDRASALRQDAISQGTIHVAMAPVGSVRRTAFELPADFTAALNDELELHHWSQPPLFVAVLDPLVVRRELRYQGLSRRPLDVRGATRVGRNLGADYVVTSRVTGFEGVEKKVTQETRSATTRADQDTSYVVARGTLDYELTVEFAVVDVKRGRKTRGGACVVTTSQDFERGEYDGDADDLELAHRERRLFHPHWQREAAREAETRLLERTNDVLAQRVFDELLACVP